MKKLMIAAATAAMVGGAFADAQVWEMSLTAKTTESKIGTVKSACDACDGATSYRKQASVKLAGLFWGCTCDEMVGLTGPVSENEGVFFWNASKKAAFYDQDAGAYADIDFAWNLLNRIGQKAADCEGVWTLNVGDFALYGAGFGKVAGCDDAAYIKSMNGNFAGTYIAGNGCKRCEEASGSAWALCDCGEATELTAAYGTWSLKYNASVTKKFAESSDWSWYKFPGDTLEAIQSLIAGPTPSPVDEKVAAFKKADEAFKAAQAVTQKAVDYATLIGNALDAGFNGDAAAVGTSVATRDAYTAREALAAENNKGAIALSPTAVGLVTYSGVVGAKTAATGSLTAKFTADTAGLTSAAALVTAFNTARGAYTTAVNANESAAEQLRIAEYQKADKKITQAQYDAIKVAYENYDAQGKLQAPCTLITLNQTADALDVAIEALNAADKAKVNGALAAFKAGWDAWRAAEQALNDADYADQKAKADVTAADRKAAYDAVTAAQDTENDARAIRTRALQDCGAACL